MARGRLRALTIRGLRTIADLSVELDGLTVLEIAALGELDDLTDRGTVASPEQQGEQRSGQPVGEAHGAAGGAWGLATGELVSVTAQAVSVLWLRRRAGGFVVAVRSGASGTVETPGRSGDGPYGTEA